MMRDWVVINGGGSGNCYPFGLIEDGVGLWGVKSGVKSGGTHDIRDDQDFGI